MFFFKKDLKTFKKCWLKYDFGFDSFNLKDFYANDAALVFVMIVYNLKSKFRVFVLQKKYRKHLPKFDTEYLL